MKLKNLEVLLLVIVGSVVLVDGEASDYFNICRRTEPNLSACVHKTLETLITTLKKGIPALGVPSIEPLPLQRIGYRAGSSESGIVSNLTGILVWGVSNTKLSNVVAKLTKQGLLTSLRLKMPKVRIVGQYEMNSKVLFLELRGRGDIEINSTDVYFELAMKGNKIRRNGIDYLHYENMAGTMNFTNSHMHLSGLFNDPALNRVTNDVINQNVDLLFNDIKPSLLAAIFKTLTDIGNKAIEKFTFNELFPK